MIKKLVFSVVVSLSLSIISYGQLTPNIQYGAAVSFSYKTSGANEVAFIRPLTESTWSFGLGYQLNNRVNLQFNYQLNTHGWRVRLKEENTGNFTDNTVYNLTYASKFLQVYKLGASYTIFKSRDININASGGFGFYHTRCSILGWTGYLNPLNTSVIDQEFAPTYVNSHKRDLKNYTFINSLGYFGLELAYSYNKNLLGLFAEIESSFNKNFDHKITYQRNGEKGEISVANRGLLLRLGIFFRPFLHIKKKEKIVEKKHPLLTE